MRSFWMISDLGLAHNLFGLGLAAGSNPIYPDYMTAVITIAFSLRCELRSNVWWSLVCSLVKNLLIQWETEQENQLDHLMKKLPTW